MNFIYLCILSVVCHEAAHVAAAKALGVRVKRIGISWKGPYIVREQGTAVDCMLISAAGPFSNLLLCFAGVLFACPTLALINLILFVSNALPYPCSDGLNVCKAIRRISGGARA